MSKYSSLIFASLFVLLVTACYEPPEYPDNPIISFKDLRFIQVDDGQDSLILTFNFTDGDGDLGLSNNVNTNPEDFRPPYHSFNAVFDDEGELILFGDTSIAFPTILRDPFGFDFQGEFEDAPFDLPAYNCKDYAFVIDQEADSLDPDQRDTVLIQENPFANNIIIDFYRKRNGVNENITSEFSVFNPQCPETFNSRFPVFDESNIGRSLEGSISYAMLSSGFPFVFSNDSIRLDFHIFDRSLNQSNVVSTPYFTLQALAGN